MNHGQIECREAVESSLEFLLERFEHAKCDSDGVSNCVRCQAVFLAKSVREMLTKRSDAANSPHSTESK